MGIFDEIRKMIGGGGSGPATRGPAPQGAGRAPVGERHELRQAHERRRAKQAELRGLDGKPLTRRRLDKYERLERVLVAEAGAFPWTEAQAREALARKGFDPAHVAAYLRSPAARRLLE